MKITLTAEDMLKGRPIPNGWHKAEITAKREAMATDGTSMNIWFTFKLVDVPGTPERDRLFNSKGFGYIKPLLAAVKGMNEVEFIAANPGGVDFDSEALIGQKCQVKIMDEIDTKSGKKYSNIVDFAPFDLKVPF